MSSCSLLFRHIGVCVCFMLKAVLGFVSGSWNPREWMTVFSVAPGEPLLLLLFFQVLKPLFGCVCGDVGCDIKSIEVLAHILATLAFLLWFFEFSQVPTCLSMTLAHCWRYMQTVKHKFLESRIPHTHTHP